MKKNHNKYIPQPQKPHTAKTARYLGPPNIENSHLSWRFSKADIGGPYTCGNFTHEDFRQLWDRLWAFEKMNVAQFRDDGSFHQKPFNELNKTQKDRLREIELDDIEIIYSFRITGTCRMWCWKYGNILLVLWWDRDHEVAPSKKRHT